MSDLAKVMEPVRAELTRYDAGTSQKSCVCSPPPTTWSHAHSSLTCAISPIDSWEKVMGQSEGLRTPPGRSPASASNWRWT